MPEKEYAIEPSVKKTVKDLDIDDQPREKAEKYGCGVLSTADLWALVLRTGVPGKPITELCREIMRDNNGRLRSLERRTREEILQTKGIGLTKAIQIEAVMELIRRYNREENNEKCIIRTSADAFRIMSSEIANLDHEEIWIILLNRRNEVIRKIRTTSGSDTASVFDLKKILKTAILHNADGLIMCHNHPSGNLRPSPQDIAITKDCKEGCRTMSIRMADHIIISTEGYFSFADEGRL